MHGRQFIDFELTFSKKADQIFFRWVIETCEYKAFVNVIGRGVEELSVKEFMRKSEVRQSVPFVVFSKIHHASVEIAEAKVVWIDEDSPEILQHQSCSR